MRAAIGSVIGIAAYSRNAAIFIALQQSVELADNYGELLALSNPTLSGPSVFKRHRTVE